MGANILCLGCVGGMSFLFFGEGVKKNQRFEFLFIVVDANLYCWVKDKSMLSRAEKPEGGITQPSSKITNNIVLLRFTFMRSSHSTMISQVD